MHPGARPLCALVGFAGCKMPEGLGQYVRSTESDLANAMP